MSEGITSSSTAVQGRHMQFAARILQGVNHSGSVTIIGPDKLPKAKKDERNEKPVQSPMRPPAPATKSTTEKASSRNSLHSFVQYFSHPTNTQSHLKGFATRAHILVKIHVKGSLCSKSRIMSRFNELYYNMKVENEEQYVKIVFCHKPEFENSQCQFLLGFNSRHNRMNILGFVLLIALNLASGDEFDSEYIQYIPGNFNVVVTIPHGGSAKPSSWPDRRPGCPNTNGVACYYSKTDPCIPDASQCSFVHVSDAHTRTIGLGVANVIMQRFGKQPHVVVLMLHRKKLDVNREKENTYSGKYDEPAQGFQPAQDVYEKYHGRIAQIRDGMVGRGILLDVHGQAHKQNSSEFGYLFNSGQIKSLILGQDTLADDHRRCSLLSLLQDTGLSAWDLLMGPNSLGKYLEDQGFDALPGPSTLTMSPIQVNALKYFHGGYTTKSHGSRFSNDKRMDAIQVEGPGE
eukprot:maker-scaffold5_size1054832-snap-gene-5.16 protein:Tk04044 transcript:maker-scaffold5_size1054832-snap-gene-5.16-mRNA-1 annotation:"PREDICTED: uncharacterized protein LOC100492536"